VNTIRLRVWVSPAMAATMPPKLPVWRKGSKPRGLKLLIDLHYSGYWADPEHQLKPAAWAEHSFGQLQADVYDIPGMS